MAGRTLAGALGLTGDWALGEDNWKAANDVNLLKLSLLVQGNVLSMVAATPGAPAEGDRHIFKATHPTDPNKVAVYDNGAWHLFAPWAGLVLHNLADNLRYEYQTATGWKKLVNRPAITDDANGTLTLSDTHINGYVRRNNAAANTITTPDSTQLANWVAGDEVRIASIGLGQTTIVAGSGITMRSPATLKLRTQHSQAVLTFEGGVVFSLTGDLASS